MKRAKILLTLIVLFTIAGGALAFRVSDVVYVRDPFNGQCTVVVTGVTTQPGGAVIGVRTFATVPGGPCITKTVYLGL